MVVLNWVNWTCQNLNLKPLVCSVWVLQKPLVCRIRALTGTPFNMWLALILPSEVPLGGMVERPVKEGRCVHQWVPCFKDWSLNEVAHQKPMCNLVSLSGSVYIGKYNARSRGVSVRCKYLVVESPW